MNKRNIFYWLIVTPFILLTVKHYQVIFFQNEVISSFSYIVSWGIGLTIEGGFIFYLYFYQKIENEHKVKFLLVQLVYIFFFQYHYYCITEKLIFNRIVFASFFPFMLGLFAFMGENLEKIGKNEDNEYFKSLGIVFKESQPQPQPQPQTQQQQQLHTELNPFTYLSKPRTQPQFVNSNNEDENELEVERSITNSHSHSVTFKRKSKPKSKSKNILEHNPDGTVTCPFCGVTGASVYQLNGAGHNTMACMEKEENRKNIEMGVKVTT